MKRPVPGLPTPSPEFDYANPSLTAPAHVVPPDSSRTWQSQSASGTSRVIARSDAACWPGASNRSMGLGSRSLPGSRGGVVGGRA